MTIVTRFAPSPTGLLHVGNARTAIINYLFTLKNKGKFMLRIDDTDAARSKDEYTAQIKDDLAWLGFKFDFEEHQSRRLAQYEVAKQKLIASGRLYECFESPEELEIKRSIAMSAGKPPIYDRAALRMSDEQRQKYINEGRVPHYRFKMQDEKITWDDMVRGQVVFEGQNLGDPILIRADGSMTYMICSTVDDIEFGITDVIRGEDHISNTAVQIQLFEALGAKAPNFGHLSLLKMKEGKISKRTGGYDIKSLREDGIDNLTLMSLFARLGTSNPVEPCMSLEEVIEKFDINSFSKSMTNYNEEDVERLNHKIISHFTYEQAKLRLKEIGCAHIDENFWNSVKPNLTRVNEIKAWWEICHNDFTADVEDKEFLQSAFNLLPENITSNTWSQWTAKLQEVTGRKGKALFMPLRKALTGLEHGPELSVLLPLIDRNKIRHRLYS